MLMRVALIGSPVLKDEFHKLYLELKRKGISACAIGLTSRWESQKARLVEKLRSVSHLVVFLEHREGWFPFLEGFASARIPRGVAFLPSQENAFEEQKLVDTVSPTILPLFTRLDSLIEYLATEQIQIGKEQELTEAKEYIVQSGIGLSEENLALCVQEGKTDLVRRFLTLGYSPDTVNAKGIPLLILAIRNKHRELVLLLMQANADVNKISADRGSSALMEAAVQGDRELVEALIEQGADLNLRSKNGQTALMLAIGEGKTEIARLLIQRGADLSPVDALGMTAKKYAELFKQREVLSLIEEKLQERM
ncbi:MAG: ankyrin repeat domain-containing protein [Spirochaetes bacterium]|nr:ankyrin repeat domain-containing protein [Spirochaetota bacterium]